MSDGSIAKIDNSTFVGCLSDSGAVISANSSQFFIGDSKFKGAVVAGKNSDRIKQGYKGARPMSYFFTAESVAYVDGITNLNGQIMQEYSTIPDQNRKSEINNCNFTSLFGEQAAIAYLQFSNLLIRSDYSTSINNNTSTSGSLILAQSSKLNLTSLNFYQNQVSEALISTITSNAYFNYCYFYLNRSDKYGTVYSRSDNLFTITKSYFTQNEGSTTSILTALSTNINVSNSTFVDNVAGSSSLVATYSYMNVTDSYFGGNTATLVTNGFIMINSTVMISKTLIENSTNIDTESGFFNIMIDSTLWLKDHTMIRNIGAKLQGLLGATTQSSLYMTNNVTVTNCTGYQSTFTVSNSPRVYISNSKFYNSPQMLFKMDQGDIEIEHSDFSSSVGNIFNLVSCYLQVTNVTMHDSIDTQSYGHGIYCQNCWSVIITNSTFTNLTALQGGALYSNANSQTISNSTFISNTALDEGGAFKIDSTVQNSFFQNIFHLNHAHSGGAILYSCDPSLNCTNSLLNNTFTNNTAVSKGGALEYLNSNFTTLVGNNFTFNKCPYGSIIGDYSVNMTIYLEGIQLFQNANFSNFIMLPIAPGHPINLTLSFFDNEGRLFTPENTAIARVEFSNQTQDNLLQVFGGSAVATAGWVEFNDLSMRMSPNTTEFAQIRIENMNDYGNSISFIETPMIIIVTARACLMGESFTEDLQCLKCPPGFYLFEIFLEPHDCSPCQTTAICYGGMDTAPMPGYWRTNNTSDVYLMCFNDKACLGGSQSHPLTVCGNGYEGLLCSQCQSDFQKNGNFNCDGCGGVAAEIGKWLVSITVSGAVIVYLWKSQMSSLHTQQPVTYVYFKILISHFQIMGVLATIDFKWDNTSAQILKLQEYIASSKTVFFPNCLVQPITLANDSLESEFRIFNFQIIAAGLWPVVMCLLAAAFWSLVNCKNKAQGQAPLVLKQKLQASMIIFMFIFYPDVIQTMIQSLNCTSLLQYSGDPSVRLMQDMTQTCFQGTHLILFITVVIPSLMIWLVLVPLYLFKQLKDDSLMIQQIQNGDITTQDAPKIAEFQTRVGFLISGFNYKNNTWELILLYRKLTIVMATVFLGQSSARTTGLILILFLCVTEFFIYKYDNYYTSKKNADNSTKMWLHPLKQVELFSALVQIITLYLGLFFTDEEGQLPAIILSVTVLAATNLGFAIFFYLRMRIEIVNWIISKNYSGKFITFFLSVFCWIKDITKYKQDKQKQEGLWLGQKNYHEEGNNNQQNENLSQSDSLMSFKSGSQTDIDYDVTGGLFTDRTGRSVISASSIELQEKTIPGSVKRALRLLPDPELLQAPRPIATLIPDKINKSMPNKPKEIVNRPQSAYNSKQVSSKTKFDSSHGSAKKPRFDSSHTSPKNAVAKDFFPDSIESSENLSQSSLPSSQRRRQVQNFNYRQELEFEKEERRIIQSSHDSDLDSDPLGMLTNRNQKAAKKQFEDTFGRSQNVLQATSKYSSSFAGSDLEERFDKIELDLKKVKQVKEEAGRFSTDMNRVNVPRLTLQFHNNIEKKSEQSSVRSEMPEAIVLPKRKKVGQRDKRPHAEQEIVIKPEILTNAQPTQSPLKKRALVKGRAKAAAKALTDRPKVKVDLHFSSDSDDGFRK